MTYFDQLAKTRTSMGEKEAELSATPEQNEAKNKYGAKAGHADPEWHKIIRDRYGTEPRVTYYEIPVVADNVIGEVHRAPVYPEALAWDQPAIPAHARNARE